MGQAWATLDSRYRHHLDGARVVILQRHRGRPGLGRAHRADRGYAGGGGTYRLIPVEVSADGTSYGTPQGWAIVTYDPNAKTISVTVNASGLTPARTPRTSTSAAARRRAPCSTC